jgi:ankyrin repeat protein
VNERNKELLTPLNASLRFGHLEIVKLLLERGADIDGANGEGITPYQESLAVGNRAMADLLREHAACAVRFEDILLWLKCDV